MLKIPPPAVEGTGYIPDFLESEEHEYLLNLYNDMTWGKVHSFKLSSTNFTLQCIPTLPMDPSVSYASLIF